MGDLFLDGGLITDTTAVSNSFIDSYMPKANGDFVKIYLHLLRLISAGSTNISLENVADVFNFTESDITRALKYWEGLGLLSLSKGKNSTITGIKFEQCISHENVGPVKRKYSARDINNFSMDEDISQLIFVAQTYMGKTLSPNDTNTILFMVDSLNFSVDLVEFLIEYCVSTNHKSMHYIEKIAMSLYEEGITSVTAAKKHLKNDNSSKFCAPVFEAFGITGRSAVKSEQEYISRWVNTYGFDLPIIIEACDRTMDKLHQPNFQYADSILSNWHNKGATTIEQIKALDEAHKNDNKRLLTLKKAAPAKSTSASSIHKFPQRSYDYTALEKQLLASRQ